MSLLVVKRNIKKGTADTEEEAGVENGKREREKNERFGPLSRRKNRSELFLRSSFFPFLFSFYSRDLCFPFFSIYKAHK